MSNQPRNGAQTPRKKFLLNDWRQPLPATDSPIDGGKYPAQFVWEQKNNGAIVLKVNDGVYKEGGKGTHKEVEMNWANRNDLFEALLEASNNPDFTIAQLVVKSKQFVFQGGQSRMSTEPVVQVTLTIGRDDKGAISLGYSKGDYKALGRFKGANENVVITKNAAGERVEDHGLLSRWAVRRYVNFHRPILDRMELDGWEPPKPRGEAAGSNNSGGGGGSRPTPAADHDAFDDDIPF